MAQLNLRIDDELKKDVDFVCSELGLTISSAIHIYLRKLSRERRIPFEVSVDPFYFKENLQHIQDGIALTILFLYQSTEEKSCMEKQKRI